LYIDVKYGVYKMEKLKMKFEYSFYDPENPQDYIYDPEITNKWYWNESLD